VQWRISALLTILGLLVLPALLVSNSAAQRGGVSASGHITSANRSPGTRAGSHAGSLAFGRNSYSGRYRQTYGYASLPFPFFDDAFGLDDLYSSGYPVASAPPPEFLLQAARSLSGSTDLSPAGGNHETSATQPLMIELQNGRYVQVSSHGEARELSNLPAETRTGSAQSARNHSMPPETTNLANSQAPVIAAAHHLPPAVLVFRDGHSEEVRDYTIADGVLYARGDYYMDGYWNKQIDLASLNLPQTLQANASRNVSFVLPSSPNEVITRF
jgi:hypothetical protein